MAVKKIGGMYVTVKDKDGNLHQGKTKNFDKLIGAKMLVYFDDGSKGLIRIDKIKVEGYYD